jgi:hypothetical protein
MQVINFQHLQIELSNILKLSTHKIILTIRLYLINSEIKI